MIEHSAVWLRNTVKKHAGRVATRIDVDGEWQTQTYAQFGKRVDSVAQGLIDHGIEPGDRIGLFAGNQPAWSEVDFGAATARVVPVPLYATSTPEQIAYIAADSGLRIMFVGGQSECERVLQVRDDLDDLELIVIFHPYPELPDGVIPYEDFLAEPKAADIEARLAEADGEDLASLTYTSGTTGEPKGVMIRHAAMIRQGIGLDQFFNITEKDQNLCFLPLSHALERGWTNIVMLRGSMNTYVMDPRTVADQMVKAKPSLMVSVPKLFERVQAVATEKASASPVKKRIFDWALAVGKRWHQANQDGQSPSLGLRLQHRIADKLVLGNIREALGGEKNVLACGGAALRVEVEDFLNAAGLDIRVGYGLTEASPLVSFNPPGNTRSGSVGQILPGGEVKIAENGEILYRGPNLMAGYWNHPEATAETLVDGWLHTGDIGRLDEDGFLYVTDRIKDIIVTTGGKNVAPQPIEGLILSDPLFEHAVVLGDDRPYLTLLVKPSLPHVEELGRLRQWPGEVSDWLASVDLRDEIRQRVNTLTAKLPKQEQPRDAAVMDAEPTMDNGLLTPTLKIRRRQVEQRFKAIIDDMYARLERAKELR